MEHNSRPTGHALSLSAQAAQISRLRLKPFRIVKDRPIYRSGLSPRRTGLRHYCVNPPGKEKARNPLSRISGLFEPARFELGRR